MPRRTPPTPLRLHNGPLPARGQPKHTLPSLPRPAFQGPAVVVPTGPVPRARMNHTELPALVIPAEATVPGLSPFSAMSGIALPTGALETWSGPSSPTSAGSMGSVRSKKSREFVRGPWDHSGAIRVPFDVGSVLPPPMPAAINVRPGEGEVAGRVGHTRGWSG